MTLMTPQDARNMYYLKTVHLAVEHNIDPWKLVKDICDKLERS